MKKTVILLRVLVAVMSLSVVTGVFADGTDSEMKTVAEKPSSYIKPKPAVEPSIKITVGKDWVATKSSSTLELIKNGKPVLTAEKTRQGVNIKIVATEAEAAGVLLKMLDTKTPKKILFQIDQTHLKGDEGKGHRNGVEGTLSPVVTLTDSGQINLVLSLLKRRGRSGTLTPLPPFFVDMNQNSGVFIQVVGADEMSNNYREYLISPENVRGIQPNTK